MQTDKWRKFEYGDRFGLSSNPSGGGNYARFAPNSNSSIGRGAGTQTVTFLSAEGRDYFLQWDAEHDRHAETARELAYLRAAIRDLITPSGRVRRKRLIDLIATMEKA